MASGQRVENEIAPVGLVRQAFTRGLQVIEAARQAGMHLGYESDDEEATSPAARYLTQNNAWKEFTNFDSATVESIWRPMNDLMKTDRHTVGQIRSHPHSTSSYTI